MPGLNTDTPDPTPSDIAYDDMTRAWRNGDYPLAWSLADALLQYLANGGQPLTGDRTVYYARFTHDYYAPLPDAPAQTPAITDCKGQPLAEGDVITGWYDDVPYTGKVVIIDPHKPGDGTFRRITVRRDDGTDHRTFSHAVIAGRRT